MLVTNTNSYQLIRDILVFTVNNSKSLHAKEVVKISQKLDEYIVQAMRKNYT